MSTPAARFRTPISRRAALAAGAAAALAGCSSAGRTGPPAASSATSRPSISPAPTTTPAPTTPPAPPTPVIDLSADPAAIIARPQVPALCYHQIRDWTAEDSESARAYICPPATFTAQLDALVSAGYATVSPDQLLAHLTTGAALPPKPVLLTYDDSDVDGYDVAFPEMVRRGFTGSYFLMTVALNKSRYLSDDQVRELDAAGMTVGAHTWDHHRVDRYAGDDWRIQIDEPTQHIAGILGHPVSYFAYPYGAWAPDAFEHLQEAGFAGAFQLDADPLDPQRPLFTLRRMIADPYWSTDTFLQHLVTGI